MGRENEHDDFGKLRTEFFRQLDAISSAGQPHIHDDCVRAHFAHSLNAFGGIAGFFADHKFIIEIEQMLESLPQHRMIVHHHNAFAFVMSHRCNFRRTLRRCRTCNRPQLCPLPKSIVRSMVSATATRISRSSRSPRKGSDLSGTDFSNIFSKNGWSAAHANDPSFPSPLHLSCEILATKSLLTSSWA